MKVNGSGPKISTEAAAYLRAIRRNEKKYRAKLDNGRDNVHVFTLPKGKHSNLLGSFSYKTPSAKAQQLKGHIASIKGKMAACRYSTQSPKERAAQMQRLKCQMAYLSSKLNAEMAATPATHVVVVAADE